VLKWKMCPVFLAKATLFPVEVLQFCVPAWLIGDRESPCSPVCSRSNSKPVCGSDGHSYDTSCDLERAKCKDRTLTLAHRGRCKGQWTSHTVV
uniref:Kazal-like domain-containing protein n=1 Tax=Cyprinus carpio TaxID=7962 RepID=A0A8C1ZKH1_CYPCA